MKRRQFLKKGVISLASLKALEHRDFLQAREPEGGPIEIQNDFVRWVIGDDGQNLHFVDESTGDDYCARSPISYFARIKKAGQEFNASAASYADGQLAVHFGKSEVSALLKVIIERHYFILEVLSVNDAQVEEMAFFDIQLTLRGFSSRSVLQAPLWRSILKQMCRNCLVRTVVSVHCAIHVSALQEQKQR